MKLYYAPGACSLSPHIVASEAGITLELEKVDLKEHKTESGQDYYQINPKGYVPALQLVDGRVLTEGPAIVSYIADKNPAANLIPPPGSFLRYRMEEWLVFINGEIHKSFSPLFGKSGDAEKDAAKAKIQKRFAYVAEMLGDHEYLTGPRFSVADAYLYVMLRWADKMGVAVPDSLARLRERVAARPAVRAALKEEGL